MKVGKISFFVTLAFVLLASGVAFAETLEGTVASLDLDGKAIEVTKKAEPGAAEEKVRVSVTDTTAYSGEATALEEMIEGDLVKLEVEKDAQGNWVAKSVEVSFGEEETIPGAEEAATAPQKA